jgi:hypothetical protein
MDFGAFHNLPAQPTRFEGVRLPGSHIELREISTVLFLLERDSLEKTLPNLLATAALCRAIEAACGRAPSLRVMGESQLWNSHQGSGENQFLQNIQPGDHALLVTAASLYRRQMAHLIGTFTLAGATFDGYPHLVDDEVPLGSREDPRTSIRALVSTLTSKVNDSHVRDLLRLAVASEDVESRDPLVLKVRAALATLQTTSSPFLRKNAGERLEVIPSIRNMIIEWRDGATMPLLCRSLSEQHDEADEIARSIWSGARELAPGLFQLIEFPYDETDEVVRDRLQVLYTKDTRARYVVEKGADRPATSLSYDEAVTFERRLGGGESPQGLLREVESIFERRKDRSCSVDLTMAELRDRDPRDTLQIILSRALYIPDPNGEQFTLLKAPEYDVVRAMMVHHIPLITHNALWIVDMKEGSARPFRILFQGQYLPRFIDMVEGES